MVEGIEPSPDRANDNWDTFIERHAMMLWAVDFFSVRTRKVKKLSQTEKSCFRGRSTSRGEASLRFGYPWKPMGNFVEYLP